MNSGRARRGLAAVVSARRGGTRPGSVTPVAQELDPFQARTRAAGALAALPMTAFGPVGTVARPVVIAGMAMTAFAGACVAVVGLVLGRPVFGRPVLARPVLGRTFAVVSAALVAGALGGRATFVATVGRTAFAAAILVGTRGTALAATLAATVVAATPATMGALRTVAVVAMRLAAIGSPAGAAVGVAASFAALRTAFAAGERAGVAVVGDRRFAGVRMASRAARTIARSAGTEPAAAAIVAAVALRTRSAATEATSAAGMPAATAAMVGPVSPFGIALGARFDGCDE